jgi:hypothetical protein
MKERATPLPVDHYPACFSLLDSAEAGEVRSGQMAQKLTETEFEQTVVEPGAQIR